jgi:hypothetical protein
MSCPDHRTVIDYKTMFPEADYLEIAGAYPTVHRDKIQEVLKGFKEGPVPVSIEITDKL